MGECVASGRSWVKLGFVGGQEMAWSTRVLVSKDGVKEVQDTDLIFLFVLTDWGVRTNHLDPQAILIKLQACWQNTWWMHFSNMGWLSESLERLIATMG